MYPYGTFSFEKTNCVGHTKFRRYTQTEVNMIFHSMTFTLHVIMFANLALVLPLVPLGSFPEEEPLSHFIHAGTVKPFWVARA